MVRGASIEKSCLGIPVIKNISFEIKSGCITALVGPNGAGKTTLLKMIAQIHKPDKGVLELDQNERGGAFTMGYVPQQNAFFYELTVKENLDYWRQGGNAYEKTVEFLELNPVLHKKASQLSGGMQRRLNMAVALINNPQFLIMDEPLTGVDITTRQSFMKWMLAFKEKGMTILYSTHHTDEIAGIADELMLMREGRLFWSGAISDTGQSLEKFIFSAFEKQ